MPTNFRPMAPENLLDAVARLDQLVTDLRILLWGNDETRNGGLLREVDKLKADTTELSNKVDAIQTELTHMHGNRGVWSVGYLCFAMAVAFAIVAVANLGGHNLWDIPPVIALGLSALFAVIGLPAFWYGFGWLR